MNKPFPDPPPLGERVAVPPPGEGSARPAGIESASVANAATSTRDPSPGRFATTLSPKGRGDQTPPAHEPAGVSALILARNEAANLPACLASLSWCDERVVVVDSASEDATECLAYTLADVVIRREFGDFASQRNAGLEAASNPWIFAVDADERSSIEQAREIRDSLSAARYAGFRVPIRSVVLGRTFRYSGTQHDRPLRLFRRDSGRWVGAVHETVSLDGRVGDLNHALQHRTIGDMKTFLEKIERYTSLEARKLAEAGDRPRFGDLTLRPVWTFFKLYLGKMGFRDGLEGLMFCAMSGVSAAVRAWKLRELTEGRGRAVTLSHEQYVAARFSAISPRFRAEVARDDYRLTACLDHFGDVAGRRILDLGCGKGRFARRLRDLGAEVIGLDGSRGMLSHASDLDCVRASALRLPFAPGSFDGVMAVEVFEHLPKGGIPRALAEIGRVLKPGGTLAIVDKNRHALDAQRPWLPRVAVKWIDERRGLWMYPAGAPVRENWFGPARFAGLLRGTFAGVNTRFLLSPAESARSIFQRFPRFRSMTLWTARAGGAAR